MREKKGIQTEFAKALWEEDLTKIEELLKKHGASYFYDYEMDWMHLLYAAVYYKKFSVVKVLLENGWDINEIGNAEGKNALYRAMLNDGEEIFLYLLEKGIDINYQCNSGNTVIMDAFYSVRLEKAIILYEKGVDMNRKNKEGEDIIIFIEENLFEEERKIWIDRFLKDPERFDETLLKKLKAKRLELLMY